MSRTGGVSRVAMASRKWSSRPTRSSGASAGARITSRPGMSRSYPRGLGRGRRGLDSNGETQLASDLATRVVSGVGGERLPPQEIFFVSTAALLQYRLTGCLKGEHYE